MSMINPTVSATSQFIGPFDVLPNIIRTSPTANAGIQFNAPFDTPPNIIQTSPLANAGIQFNKPFDILPNKTYNTIGAMPALPISDPTQFNAPFDILPNKLYNTEDANPKLPISNPTQFIASASYNPTVFQEYDTNSATAYFTGSDYKDSAGYFKNYAGSLLNSGSAIWRPNSTINTNITQETIKAKAAGFALSSLGGFTGLPFVTQIGQSIFGAGGEDSLSGHYKTLDLNQLRPEPGILYADFRSRLGIKSQSDENGEKVLNFIASKRFDGASAVLRKGWRGAIYAAASASPYGPYSVFNLETLYGWGEHDNPNAIRSDFTMRSHVATNWRTSAKFQKKANVRNPKTPGDFIPTRNPLEMATPFRGDKISVIDFSQRKLSDAYDWKRSFIKGEAGLGKFLKKVADAADLTQDFIKFYFTGPKLYAGNTDDDDDIIVFRAIINSFSETFNPGWSDQKMIGRADPNYTYSGFSRDLSIDFDIYATDRDELKPIYRKLNALAGYTTPTYDTKSIAMQAPWMRLTIGDLYVQTPVLLKSLSYTYAMDAPWEINIEDDPTMMQVPKKISVSCGFNVITDYLPQKGGRFWTLAKTFEAKSAVPKAGNDNWLSDTLGNIDETEVEERNVGGKGKKRITKNLKNLKEEINNIKNTFLNNKK